MEDEILLYLICGALLIIIGALYLYIRVFAARTAALLARLSMVTLGEIDFRAVVHEGGYELKKAHRFDAGFDILSPVAADVPARGSTVIDTLVSVEIPNGYVGILKSKSGLNVKHDITGTGTIDCGYTGTIRVKLYNNGDRGYHFDAGDKLIQLVILPCIVGGPKYVDRLEDTERGENGFGSSGK